MKRIITLITLLSIQYTLFAQTPPINNQWLRITETIGEPEYNPSQVTWKIGYINRNRTTGESKIWNSTTKKWEQSNILNGLPTGGDGRTIEMRATDSSIEWKYIDEANWRFLIAKSELKGEQGIPGVTGTINIGTVTTLMPGSNATVTNSGTPTNAILNFGIPRGADGSSGSSSTTAFATPSSYPGTDAEKLDACIASGKPIFIDMNLTINRPVNLPNSRTNGLVIYGNFYKIKSNSNFSGYLIGRPTPNSLNNAALMMNYPIVIRDIQLEGYLNQTGIDLGATYGAWYENIYCYNLNIGLHLKFALQTTVLNIRAWSCNTISIADWYQGQSWATVHNSQSNLTAYYAPRLYSTINSAKGIVMNSCDGCEVHRMVIEGTSAKNAVVWDAMGANTVKKFRLMGLHVECVNGLTGAAIMLSTPGGFAEISDIIGHYADTMINATSSGSSLVVHVRNVPWWVPKNGKSFVNNNCGWTFGGIGQNLLNPNNVNGSIQSQFAGQTPQPVSDKISGITATLQIQPITFTVPGVVPWTTTLNPTGTVSINTANAKIEPSGVVGYNLFKVLY